MAERTRPELLQAVATGIVGAGDALIVVRQLPGQAALVTHRLDDQFPAFGDDQRCRDAGKDAAVAVLRLSSLQFGRLGQGAIHTVARYPHVLSGLLGLAHLQRAQRRPAACGWRTAPVAEDGLDPVPLLGLGSHRKLLGARTGPEGIVRGLGHLRPLLAQDVRVRRREILQRQRGTGYADQLC